MSNQYDVPVNNCGAETPRPRDRNIAVLMSVHSKIEGRSFKQALYSVLGQSWRHFDLYVMLDGPQNIGVMSCLEGVRDDRIRLVTSPQNRGLARSLNKLIDVAAPLGYDFYARMDADDVASPRRFEAQLQYFSEHASVDVLGSACIEIDAEGHELGCVRKPSGNVALRTGLPLRNPFIHPTVMFRCRVFGAGYRYPTDGHLIEDYSMWVLLQSAGFTFANLEEPMLWFRRDVGCLHRRRGFQHAWAELRVRVRSLKIPGTFRWTHLGWIAATFFSKLLPAPLLGALYKLHRRVCMNNSQLQAGR